MGVWAGAKIALYDFYTGWKSSSNDVTANVVVNDLDLNFQLSILARKCNHWYRHQISPLQVLCVMTLTYIVKVTKFEMSTTWKRLELTEKCSSMTFIEIDICHRMAPLRLVYSMTVTFFSRSNIFLLCICYKKNCTTITKLWTMQTPTKHW